MNPNRKQIFNKNDQIAYILLYLCMGSLFACNLRRPLVPSHIRKPFKSIGYIFFFQLVIMVFDQNYSKFERRTIYLITLICKLSNNLFDKPPLCLPGVNSLKPFTMIVCKRVQWTVHIFLHLFKTIMISYTFIDFHTWSLNFWLAGEIWAIKVYVVCKWVVSDLFNFFICILYRGLPNLV